LQAGDWVEVRGPAEIAETLDAEGTLDGLPFMPEMAEFCGRRMRVVRQAGKVCVEYPGVVYQMRVIRHDDAVILETRCSGAGHDGCGRACVLLWKEAWLRKAEEPWETAAIHPIAKQTLIAGLRTITASGRYICQSTELERATEPLTRWQVIARCVSDVVRGNRGLFEMMRMVIVPVLRYFIIERLERPIRVGALRRTPVGSLNLQPGELVRIKPEGEIVQTLDAQARNRGLSCDRGMRTYCGGEFRVVGRLDKMISESSGEMRKVDGTVILEGLHCMCWWNHVGGCSRQDYMYWREAWLERTNEAAGGTPQPAAGTPSAMR